MPKNKRNICRILKSTVITVVILEIAALMLSPATIVKAQTAERLRGDIIDTSPAPSGEFIGVPTGPEIEAFRKELDQASQPSTASKGDIVKAGCNIFSEGPGCVIYWILDALSDVIVTLFVSLAALAFDYVIQYAVNIDLASSAFVKIGFGITIGVANMFFVLVLLWIAIATIFDFEPYTARSLLLKLIIAALLINFSLAIGNSFIRLSNGIAMIFYNNLTQVPSGAGVKTIPGTSISLALSPIAARVMEMSQYAMLIDTSATRTTDVQRRAELEEIINKAKCAVEYGSDGTTVVMRSCQGTKEITSQEAEDAWDEHFAMPKNDQGALLTAFQAIFWKLLMVPVIIFVLFAGIIFIIIRELSLAFVLVLGPLAFLFMILPATQRFYNQWWEKLTQWSFFLPAFMFFLLLSLRVGGGILPESITSSDDRLPVMFQYFMTIGLLIGSLLAANQMGIWGASTVTGWGRKMAGAAGGWAKGTGKFLGGAAIRRGLLDTRVGRAIAATPYARGLLRPFEAAAVAGQKVKDAREKAAIQRRAMAAKAAPQYRWALMQGMAESERADFIRELKPHQVKQVMGIASEDQRMKLYQEMKKYDLEEKVLDAIEDLTSVIATETNTASTDPRFQEAVNSWIKSAPKAELQKRISAKDIYDETTGGNKFLQQAIREHGDEQDLKDIVHTREKSIAFGDWLGKMAGAERQIKNLMNQGRTRAQAMADTGVVDTIVTGPLPINPRIKQHLADMSVRIKVEHGIALGKKAPKDRREPATEETPPAPPTPPTPPTP